MHKRGYWTYERVLRESKKYKTKAEFKAGCSTAYRLACNNKWIDDFSWLSAKRKPNNYWTLEKAAEIALKYKTKSEFSSNAGSIYAISCKNGWIDKFTWLQDNRFDLNKDRIDSIYSYEFKDYNSVYIGRTLMRTQAQRNWQHLFNDTDAVHIFATEHKIDVPDMKILEDNLTLEEGALGEGIWVNKYKSEGWNVLNRAKTGSIGSLGRGKWNYERTMSEAKKYTTRKEFEYGTPGAYHSARRNNWLVDYDWFVSTRGESVRKWTKESTEQEARKYKTRGEFREKNVSAYGVALEKGWIDEYDWFVDGHKIRADRDRIWTHDKTKSEAQKYTKRSDFKTGSGSAYSAALKNKWLDEFFPKTKKI